VSERVPGTDRRSRLVRQAPVLAVLTIAAIGMGRVLAQHWREGAVLLGVALFVAAALRLLLSPERAGLLAIRSRVLDVLSYSGFGLAMVLLAATITRNPLTAG
jgi:hypothetical protein